MLKKFSASSVPELIMPNVWSCHLSPFLKPLPPRSFGGCIDPRPAQLKTRLPPAKSPVDGMKPGAVSHCAWGHAVHAVQHHPVIPLKPELQPKPSPTFFCGVRTWAG